LISPGCAIGSTPLPCRGANCWALREVVIKVPWRALGRRHCRDAAVGFSASREVRKRWGYKKVNLVVLIAVN
jgi:hypothetical protein